jgi:outer membrane biosynthesis protein TonB
MTEVRVSERRGMDTGEAADGRSDVPMDMAMEMATAVTSIAAGTAGEAALEPMERKENGKRSRSEVPATAWPIGDLRSCMERVAQPQARELAQLHRTITKMANMLEMHTALQEAQWRGMKSWLEGKEKKRDAYHQDDLLWGEGITDMVTRAVAATERGQKEERRADTSGVGLEASIHTDLTQTGGPGKPEECQQLQPGRHLKSMPTPKLKPKPNPKPSPKPNPTPAPALASRPAPTPTPRATSAPRGATTSAPTPTPTGPWETVSPRNQNMPASPGQALTTGSSMADRRLILRRDETVRLPNKMD